MDTMDVRQVHDGFESNEIPLDVLWLDIEHTDEKKYFTWHSKKFEDPSAMQTELAKLGRKVNRTFVNTLR
jgi:alpha 1,3-glucosidase